MSYRTLSTILICAVLCMMGVFGMNAQEPSNEVYPYSILYTSSDSRAYSDIYAIDTNDKNVILLVKDALAKWPIWSFSNGKLAFVSAQDRGTDILVLAFNHKVAVNLTQNQAYENFPRWSPDGKRIAFSSDLNGDSEVLSSMQMALV